MKSSCFKHDARRTIYFSNALGNILQLNVFLKSKMHYAIVAVFVILLGGCGCQTEAVTATGFTNNLDVDIDVEFRYFDGENNDGSLVYIYGSQTIFSHGAMYYELKVETRKDHGTECIRDSSGVVETMSAPVQFSLSTLSQYTVCDSLGVVSQNDEKSPRYDIYSIGTSCGDYRLVDISEGY